MALIVQKYGGSSVADGEKILNVARRVAGAASGEGRGSGHRLVVVVSAMGKATDELWPWPSASHLPDGREMDMLLATGGKNHRAAGHAPPRPG
jgi:aspartate kinase